MTWQKPKWFPNKHRRLLYFYLLQLVIPAGFLAYADNTLQIALGAGLILLFGVFYTVSFAAAGTTRLVASVGMMMIMWWLAWWLSPGYLCLAYYPAAVLSFLRKGKLVLGYSILLVPSILEIEVLLRRYHTQFESFIPALLGALFGLFAMAFMIRYYTKIQLTNEQLERANAEIERLTKAGERQRISRDLHDVMGHQLSMITLKAQVAAKLVDNGRNLVRARTEIAEIEQAAREALTRVREYVADMRQADFTEEWVSAQTLLQTANIDCTVVDHTDQPKTGSVYQVLAMCLREGVTNIVRHSAAKRAYLRVEECDDERVQLWIADDGLGIAGVKQPCSLQGREADTWLGNGIKGIRARVDAIGGHLQIFWRSEGTNQADAWGGLEGHPADWCAGVLIHIEAPLQQRAPFAEVGVR